jgi:epoxide hydrolase 4
MRDMPGTKPIISIEQVHLPAMGGVQPWLSCRVAGPRGAPLLLFLHGFPEAAFVWDEMLLHFGSRYRCVAPNLRGYPGSYSPDEVKAYRAKEMLPDLLALIAAQAAAPSTPAAAVIAHDWGGALAWGLAAVAPQCLRRLVVLNAPHPALFLAALRDDPTQQAASAYMNQLREPGVEAQLAANDFAGMWPFFEHFGGAGWLTPALRDRYREAWAHGLTGPLNYYRASPLHPPTSPNDAIHTLNLPDALTQVSVPTSVLWGEADTALPPSLLDGLQSYVPDLHVSRLPDATHWLVHEQPNAVAHAIEQALSKS